MPANPDLPRRVVAAFDVDGTVTTRDCVVPFLRRFGGAPHLARGLLGRLGPVLAALARRDRDRFKTLLSHSAFAGLPASEVEREGAAFAVELEHHRLRADTMARLAWHRAHGHATVLVSASYAAYLRPLAASLGIDGVVATELEVGADGRCTGALLGGNCRAGAKVARLHAWLAEHQGGRGAVELWAYGDSPGDLELLADADHAVWAKDVVLAPVPEMA